MITAPSIPGQSPAAPCRDAVRRDVRLEHGPRDVSRQDDAAVSNSLPPATSHPAFRAALAAARGSSQLAAALAFFRSRSASRLAEPQTSRLRL